MKEKSLQEEPIVLLGGVILFFICRSYRSYKEACFSILLYYWLIFAMLLDRLQILEFY